jgi:hypothetical protein
MARQVFTGACLAPKKCVLSRNCDVLNFYRKFVFCLVFIVLLGAVERLCFVVDGRFGGVGHISVLPCGDVAQFALWSAFYL